VAAEEEADLSLAAGRAGTGPRSAPTPSAASLQPVAAPAGSGVRARRGVAPPVRASRIVSTIPVWAARVEQATHLPAAWSDTSQANAARAASHGGLFGRTLTASRRTPPTPQPKGTEPAPTEGSADLAPPASAAKATEALLPSLTIWLPSQRTHDAVVCCLMQTLAAPNVLSQHYGAVPEPEAEHTAAVQADAFAAASESAVGASPASIEGVIEVLQA